MKCSISSCTRTAHTRGWCQAHYKRVVMKGDPSANMPLSGSALSIEQRIDSKSTYVPFTGCRIWLGACSKSGYGFIAYEGKQQYTHRVAWQLARGPIAEGMLILHSCDTPACINTNHLFIGTQSDNMRDMHDKGRANHTNKARGSKHHLFGISWSPGEQHYNAKLTKESVSQIRADYKPGIIKQIDLAKKYGVKQAQISSIIRGKSWV